MNIENIYRFIEQVQQERYKLADEEAKARYVLEAKDCIYADNVAEAISVFFQQIKANINFKLNHLFLGLDGKPDEDPELACFFLLEFPSISFNIMQNEKASPFELAYGLSEGISAYVELSSVEPDLETEFYLGPQPAVGDIINEITRCDGPQYKLWALNNINAPQAWNVCPSKGAGIDVGHPDTGYTNHTEIQKPIAPKRGNNFVERSIFTPGGTWIDPKDPLNYKGNKGHGTSTASVLASDDSGNITGSAPEATVIPIRTIKSVAKITISAVAKAVHFSLINQFHVISMSLGGLLYSRGLHTAIRKAVKQNIILLAAAGNYWPWVVYPARYSEVICVAANNELDDPWDWSAKGWKVDFSAPGEGVWKATQKNPNDPYDEVEHGCGTSYSTALTAGAAAVWLDYHDRQKLIDQMTIGGGQYIYLQDLFRDIASKTARQPNGWDTGNFGEGILNMEDLLNSPIPNPDKVQSSMKKWSYMTLSEAIAEIRFSRKAKEERQMKKSDIEKYGLEILWLSMDQKQFSKQNEQWEIVGVGNWRDRASEKIRDEFEDEMLEEIIGS